MDRLQLMSICRAVSLARIFEFFEGGWVGFFLKSYSKLKKFSNRKGSVPKSPQLRTCSRALTPQSLFFMKNAWLMAVICKLFRYPEWNENFQDFFIPFCVLKIIQDLKNRKIYFSTSKCQSGQGYLPSQGSLELLKIF